MLLQIDSYAKRYKFLVILFISFMCYSFLSVDYYFKVAKLENIVKSNLKISIPNENPLQPFNTIFDKTNKSRLNNNIELANIDKEKFLKHNDLHLRNFSSNLKINNQNFQLPFSQKEFQVFIPRSPPSAICWAYASHSN